MKRLYHQLVKEHFQQMRQMVFLAGARQVGKTTIGLLLEKGARGFCYFNWDKDDDRLIVLEGADAVAEEIGLLEADIHKPIVVFDEIHKYKRWKQFLKGFFDVYGERCYILVTGSTKLNIYKCSGDSLMGRYFLYRIHPLSIAEIVRPAIEEKLIRPPKKITKKAFEQLIEFGGFPEPYLRANRRFSSNWQRMREEQLIQEDIRDLSQIQDLAQFDMLSRLLKEHAGQLLNKSAMANRINVSVPTITRWLSTLESFYHCFSLRPWSKNVTRSLRKEPKYYLWDWSLIENRGARLENMVASHLLKATQFWTDYGLGTFDLFYLRDKEKREVDFLVTRDGKPWFLVEAKAGNSLGISKALYHFQKQVQASHAFQVSFGLDYRPVDCFSYTQPIIVPATTFLSQLI